MYDKFIAVAAYAIVMSIVIAMAGIGASFAYFMITWALGLR